MLPCPRPLPYVEVQIFLQLTPLSLNFCSLVSINNLSKSTTCYLTVVNTTHSARNLGFIIDEHLAFSDQISSVSKSCYNHIRQLRCIRPYLNCKAGSTIASSTVHSKLDYCNSQFSDHPAPTDPELLHVR